MFSRFGGGCRSCFRVSLRNFILRTPAVFPQNLTNEKSLRIACIIRGSNVQTHIAAMIRSVSIPIHVNAYSGYKANERPLEFVLDDDYYEIVEVEDRWYEPEAVYFRVRTTDGKRYLLRYNETADDWTLQSGFDGDELLSRPGINVITLDADVIRRAEKMIIACEHCHPDDTGSRSTGFWIKLPKEWRDNTLRAGCGCGCPTCNREVREKRLVDLRDEE